MDDQQKRDLIAAKRGPLENELYAAELDRKTAEAGEDEALVEEPKAREAEVKKKLKVLDEEEAKIGK